jgi:hypothetical protein
MEHSEPSQPHSPPTPTAPGAPSAETLDALRRGLRSRITHVESGVDLRQAIVLLCEDAHRRGLTAEQLILLVKDVWHRMPEVQHLPRSLRQDEALSRTITICIEEYYARAREGRTPGG